MPAGSWLASKGQLVPCVSSAHTNKTLIELASRSTGFATNHIDILHPVAAEKWYLFGSGF